MKNDVHMLNIIKWDKLPLLLALYVHNQIGFKRRTMGECTFSPEILLGQGIIFCQGFKNFSTVNFDRTEILPYSLIAK